jgi:hypothetical protein
MASRPKRNVIADVKIPSQNFCFVSCQEFYDLELASTKSSLNNVWTKEGNYSLASQNTLQTRVFGGYF